MVRWRQGRCPEAAETARKALDGLADGPERAGLVRIAALCFLKEGKHAEAISALEEAVRLEPGAADAAFELALALERAGQGGRAAEAYAGYLGRFAEDARAPLAALRLGRLRAARGSREEALSAFRRAARARDPEVAGPAGHEIARHLESEGKAEDALAAYEALAGAGPLKEEWRRASAWRAASLRERRGDWDRALALYRRLAAERADAAESRQALARAARIEGYLKQVLEREEKMKKREPLLR
jgi:tetratricopeptide (TPR) repeat protein